MMLTSANLPSGLRVEVSAVDLLLHRVYQNDSTRIYLVRLGGLESSVDLSSNESTGFQSLAARILLPVGYQFGTKFVPPTGWPPNSFQIKIQCPIERDLSGQWRIPRISIIHSEIISFKRKLINCQLHVDLNCRFRVDCRAFWVNSPNFHSVLFAPDLLGRWCERVISARIRNQWKRKLEGKTAQFFQ